MVSASWATSLARATVRATSGRGQASLRVAVGAAALALVVLVHLLLAVGGFAPRWLSVSPARDVAAEPTFAWNQVFSVVDGAALTVVVVHADGTADAPVPPGLERFPAAGEAVVSPALRDVLQRRPVLGGRVPGRVVGTIGRDGLVAPDELRAVVALNGAGDLYPGTGWGSGDVETFGLPPVAQTRTMLVLLWGLPSLIVLAACGRSVVDTVRGQAARLRLVGASGAQVRQYVHAFALRTSAVPAGVGALVGTVAVLLLSGPGALGVAFFPVGLVGTVVVGSAAAGMVTATVGVCASVSSRRAAARAYVAARGSGGPGSAWPAVLALAGAFMLVGLSAVRWITADPRVPGAAATATMLVGAGLLVSGAALGAGRLARWVSVRARAGRVESQLAWRQLGHTPRPLVLATLAMTAVATVFAMTFAVLEILGEPVSSSSARWTVSVSGSAAPDVRALVDAVGPDAVLEVIEGDASSVWGTCEALSEAFGTLRGPDGAGCVDGREYQPGELVRGPFDEPPSIFGAAALVRAVDPHTVPVEVPRSASAYLGARLDDPLRQQSALLRAAPTAAMTLDSADQSLLVVVPAAQALTTRSATAGGILSVIATALAVSLVPEAAASERRLRRLGADRATVRRFAATRAALTMLVAGVVGGGAALLVEQSYLALGSRYVVDMTTAAGLAVVVLLTAAAAVVAGALGAGGDEPVRP
ncbi:hypothetical protein [Cellulomonas uda]|uniref:ABC3 transporter permease protein domain-containing protein n=1 Tax=Cellulomonas uda TaxID=1714 RepID=A0A4Y3KC32_CELUD|nr:hypothetical protein [Cellulomonas uda]NII64941.1 hypothetical protein [Cellulomonas uda]GEA82021.1 hypothetical protein CUD01_24650 [Cellulomonas uda]